MSPSKEVVLYFTIFLTFGTILLVLAVIGIYLFYRKLRKKIEETIDSDSPIEMDTKKVENESLQKKNKYIKSFKQDKGETDQDNYDLPIIEIPDLLNYPGYGRDAHDHRDMNAGHFDTTDNVHTAVNETTVQNVGVRPGVTAYAYREESGQQNANANQSFQIGPNISDPSYLEMINSGEVIEETYYTEPSDKPNVGRISKDAPKPQLPPRHHPRHVASRTTATQQHAAEKTFYEDDVIETYYTEPTDNPSVGTSKHAPKPQLPARQHPRHGEPRSAAMQKHAVEETFYEDDVIETYYTEPTDNPSVGTSKHAPKPQLPARQHPRHGEPRSAAMQKYADEEAFYEDDVIETYYTEPTDQPNIGASQLPIRPQLPSEPHPWQFGPQSDTQQHASHHNLSRPMKYMDDAGNMGQYGLDRETRLTHDMHKTKVVQEEDYYLPMASNNHGYQEDDFYGNQEVINSHQSTGSPCNDDEEEKFENQEIVDEHICLKSCQVTSSISYMSKPYHQNVNSKETSQVLQEDPYYQNYGGGHVITEDHICTNEKADNGLPIYGNFGQQAEEEHIYGNETMFSSC